MAFLDHTFLFLPLKETAYAPFSTLFLLIFYLKKKRETLSTLIFDLSPLIFIQDPAWAYCSARSCCLTIGSLIGCLIISNYIYSNYFFDPLILFIGFI